MVGTKKCELRMFQTEALLETDEVFIRRRDASCLERSITLSRETGAFVMQVLRHAFVIAEDILVHLTLFVSSVSANATIYNAGAH